MVCSCGFCVLQGSKPTLLQQRFPIFIASIIKTRTMYSIYATKVFKTTDVGTLWLPNASTKLSKKLKSYYFTLIKIKNTLRVFYYKTYLNYPGKLPCASHIRLPIKPPSFSAAFKRLLSWFLSFIRKQPILFSELPFQHFVLLQSLLNDMLYSLQRQIAIRNGTSIILQPSIRLLHATQLLLLIIQLLIIQTTRHRFV